MTDTARSANGLLAALIDRLRTPMPTEPGHAQSLADGAAGIALLHIERARSGHADWTIVHRWLTAATAEEIIAADHTSLLFGAPAIAFTLHCAAAGQPDRYSRAVRALDIAVENVAHQRVDLANARLNRGDPLAFREYDLLHGLTGIGAHLLRHAPRSDALGRVLSYLVRLTTTTQRVNGVVVPGWWTAHPPDQRTPLPGGHANLGLAHGVTGPLTQLARAYQQGHTVDGQAEAIRRTCDWLDQWQQHDPVTGGAFWPGWISLARFRGEPARHNRPGPPSWCYGTPGQAHAQQTAAIALGDQTRQATAEQALIACLSDPTQLDQVADLSLCHGWAGLRHTAWRTAENARSPALFGLLPELTDQLLRRARRASGESLGPGLLDGFAGLALAAHTAVHGTPLTAWDTAFLLH